MTELGTGGLIVWEDGSFARDTLIHSFACLSSTVLAAAFRDPGVVDAYRNWTRRIASDDSLANCGEQLLAAGIHGATAVLIARGVRDEFCLRCEHPRFGALVALGYEVKDRRLAGVCVAKFDGYMSAAMRFCSDLGAHIEHRTPHRSSRVRTSSQAN